MEQQSKVRKPILLSLMILMGANTTAAQNLERDRIGLRTRLVLIDVLVTEKRTGAPVSDLVRGDFEVLEEGKRRAVSHFSVGEERPPLALMLLFDLSHHGAARYFQEVEVLKSLDAALLKLSPQDEVDVVSTEITVKGLTQPRRSEERRVGKECRL